MRGRYSGICSGEPGYGGRWVNIFCLSIVLRLLIFPRQRGACVYTG